MIVSDIKNSVTRILGKCDDAIIYDRITHAVSTLACRGNWEPLLGYLDITVASGNVVTLPPQVQNVIKVNINNNPSFSRTRLYEFSLNGPTNDMSETTGYSWMDKGTVATMVPLGATSLLRAVSSAGDNGKLLRIYGRNSDGVEISDTLTLNATTPPVTLNSYKYIDRVLKDATAATVALQTSPGAVLLSTYSPSETEPQYRQILLSKPAASVKMLFRRNTFKITNDLDFIPLNSQMAMLLMVLSIEKYLSDTTTEGLALAKGYEEEAVRLCKEEQESRTGFDISQTDEIQTPLDLNYNNRDSIIVADIFDDVATILGPVGRGKVFDHITESLEALNNKSQWDGMDGYIDITVDDSTITLPRYVEVPIEVNIGGRPAQMRNKWFEFHLNGPGQECCGSCSWMWDDRGDVVTIKDVDYEQQLIAIPDLTEDNGKRIRIYGYEADENGQEKWIKTVNPITSQLDDGFWITISTSAIVPPTDSQKVTRIERIVKDVTKGFVSLQGFDIARNAIVIQGYYYPDETEPNYRRIRIGGSCDWVRMRYRKRTLKVTSLTDPLHLKSKLAIMLMARALVSYKKGEADKAAEMELLATQKLLEEQQSRNPGDVTKFSFDRATSMSDPMQGQY